MFSRKYFLILMSTLFLASCFSSVTSELKDNYSSGKISELQYYQGMYDYIREEGSASTRASWMKYYNHMIQLTKLKRSRAISDADYRSELTKADIFKAEIEAVESAEDRARWQSMARGFKCMTLDGC